MNRPMYAALASLLCAAALPGCGNNRAGRAELPREAAAPPAGRGAEALRAPRQEEGPPRNPGSGVLLRMQRTENRPLLYEGSFERRQEGKNKYLETASFYTAFTCVSREADKGGRSLDLVTILRTFTDRTCKETTETGKMVDRILPNTEDLIELGPSFKSVAGMRCYAFDAQNNVAQFFDDAVALKDGTVIRGKVVSSETDENRVTLETTEGPKMFPRVKVDEIKRVTLPHVLHYESPHYFFPILSRRTVSPGETWTVSVPMVIPINHGNQGGILPTQFVVKVTGRLRELQGRDAGQVALVDYQAAGRFDSSLPPYAERFGDSFREMNQIVHAIEGEGWASVDVEKGQLLEKQEEMRIHLEGRSTLLQGSDKVPQEDRNVLDVTSRFRLKLLAPGARLKNGLVVPPNR